MTHRQETNTKNGFVIRNDPNRSTQSLFWTGFEVVGILRANEALRFKTELEAWGYLSGCNYDGAKFYGLTVARDTCCQLPDFNHGWMVGHPGYDLH